MNLYGFEIHKNQLLRNVILKKRNSIHRKCLNYSSNLVRFMGLEGVITISYRHSGQIYASQPVQAKQLLHDLGSRVLSHDIPQWVQVTSESESSMQCVYFREELIVLISFTNPNRITCVKIMVAPEGISAKYEINNPIKDARKANPTE